MLVIVVLIIKYAFKIMIIEKYTRKSLTIINSFSIQLSDLKTATAK